MQANNRLMEMLTGYAAAHQNPVNIFVHMIGIPTIMFGALIPLTWLQTEVSGVAVSLAHVLVLGFFLFYLTLDKVFAAVFAVFALLIAQFSAWVGEQPIAISEQSPLVLFSAATCCNLSVTLLRKSMPVLVKHPIQANLAAPFFTVVEIFKILRLRDDLFSEVQNRIAAQRNQEAGSA